VLVYAYHFTALTANSQGLKMKKAKLDNKVSIFSWT